MAAAGLSSSGPTPWWQLPGTGDRPNLEQSAPSGYAYDPVQQGYERTPTSAGQRLGAALNGLKGSGGLDGFGSMYGLSSSSGSAGPVGSSTQFPTVGYGSASAGSSGGRIAPATMDTGALDAAGAAAFGHAKDQASKTASAAITGLSGELQRRGMGGAGYEGGQIGGTLAREANTIGEASRAEATNRAGVVQHVADENYQGGIAQRGQDIGSQDAQYSGGIAQRGQDIGRANAQDQLNLQSQELAQRKQIALANLFSGSVNGLVNTLSRSY